MLQFYYGKLSGDKRKSLLQKGERKDSDAAIADSRFWGFIVHQNWGSHSLFPLAMRGIQVHPALFFATIKLVIMRRKK
jgi:hypothetical protein